MSHINYMCGIIRRCLFISYRKRWYFFGIYVPKKGIFFTIARPKLIICHRLVDFCSDLLLGDNTVSVGCSHSLPWFL